MNILLRWAAVPSLVICCAFQSAHAACAQSDLAGRWSAQYRVGPPRQIGECGIAIDASGKVTGACENQTFGSTFNIVRGTAVIKKNCTVKTKIVFLGGQQSKFQGRLAGNRLGVKGNVTTRQRGFSASGKMRLTKEISLRANGDGTVSDQRTGLVWMRCAVGQAWTGAACEGVAASLNWASALAYTSSFANASTWRLPSISELADLVRYGQSTSDWYDPTALPLAFPGVPTGAYWAATLASYPNYETNDSYVIAYPGGATDLDYFAAPDDEHFVWMVR